jgi:hypothetical protein
MLGAPPLNVKAYILCPEPGPTTKSSVDVVVTATYHQDAVQAIASVVEAQCPLCDVEMRIYDARACCPCCGDSYRASNSRLEVGQCPVHGRYCDHWEAVWATRGDA